ncbi:MAG: ATP synthase F1 subunit delta [Prolixibacteraceae bacterium]|jgi:F-type H+-transporting ATPase subunit delta|nr:ATP synthase F1 subunit delta [Prolixibacteraceae bacterium]
MDQSKITVRYAKALFELAKEKDQVEVFKTGVSSVVSVLQSSADFNFLLESPVIPASQKLKAVRLIFSGNIDETILRFLELIVENKREQHIPGICRNFLDLIRREQGIKTALVTSAAPLSPEKLGQLKALLESDLKTSIEISEKVNGELLGGFILRIGDQQYDASIATRLKKLKETLLKTEIK